jgi:hypothetical protein
MMLISGIVVFYFYDCMLQICSFETYKVVILLWLILPIVKLMQISSTISDLQGNII